MKQSLEKNEMTKILVIFRWGWGAVGGGAYSRGQEKNLSGSFSTALFIDSEIREKVRRMKGKVSLWQELLVWGWQMGTCWNSHCLLPWIKRMGHLPSLAGTAASSVHGHYSLLLVHPKKIIHKISKLNRTSHSYPVSIYCKKPLKEKKT